ncbi:MAG TPA: hypothetical protein PLP83_03870 [Candidatus Aminicenantes bacterium]|nr:hypothetical protein [Candidatus Aminicenantes bacterium]
MTTPNRRTAAALPTSPVLAPLLLLALAAGLAACKAPVPEDVPGEFTFRGVAVHPAAVNALYRSGEGQLDLAAFKTRYDCLQWEAQPGWWVTEYEEDPMTKRAPFFAYSAWAGPQTGGAETYILSVTFNAGEEADIDTILLLRKSGSWLGLVRAWEEGSACDGGIQSQRMEGDEFFYSRELTPIGLLGLALLDRPFDLNPHEDLEGATESCVAAASYVYSLAQDREDLISVRLYDEPAVDVRGKTDRLRFQSCFNRILNAYLAEKRTVLSPKDVDEFAARFRNECLGPGSGDAAGK